MAGAAPTTAYQQSFADLGTPLIDVCFVVVDLETTGLVAGTDRITEVGAVKVRGGDLVGELHTLVHPGRTIPPAITTVTGITDGMVRGSPAIASVLPAFLEFTRDTVLVAHNARFDVGFLDAELARHGYPRLTNPVVDTAALARRLVRDEVRSLRLSALASHFRARTSPIHRALPDARATVDVLHGLIERAGSLGATTLEDLVDLTRSSSDRAFRKRHLVHDAPSAPGVYRFLDDQGRVLYVGKARDLRLRLRRYFGQDRRRRIGDLVREADRVEWTVCRTELEAEVEEVRAIHRHRPRYNRRSRQPQAQVYVKLTDERFPRLSIVSQVRDDAALYLGPISSRGVAERFAEAVHDVLPLRRCTQRLRVAQDHPPCVLKDLGRCGAPCDGTQSATDYAAVAERFRRSIDDPARLLEALRERMRQLARDGRYERAALARVRLHTAAQVLAGHREIAGLVAGGTLAARRDGPEGVEAVLVVAGRLAGAATLPATTSDEEVRTCLDLDAAPTGRPVAPPTRDDAEEVRLVGSWLRQPGVRVVWVDGTLAEPAIGGAVLRRTVAEAKAVARQVRRDHQTLTATKVARRSDT